MDNIFDRVGPYRGEFVRPLISPDSLLDEFIIKVLAPTMPADLQRGEEQFQREEDMRNFRDRGQPPIQVDPMELNLEEYRRPGPSYPGEPLDRVRFLLSPRSPLS